MRIVVFQISAGISRTGRHLRSVPDQTESSLHPTRELIRRQRTVVNRPFGRHPSRFKIRSVQMKCHRHIGLQHTVHIARFASRKIARHRNRQIPLPFFSDFCSVTEIIENAERNHPLRIKALSDQIIPHPAVVTDHHIKRSKKLIVSYSVRLLIDLLHPADSAAKRLEIMDQRHEGGLLPLPDCRNETQHHPVRIHRVLIENDVPGLKLMPEFLHSKCRYGQKPKLLNELRLLFRKCGHIKSPHAHLAGNPENVPRRLRTGGLLPVRTSVQNVFHTRLRSAAGQSPGIPAAFLPAAFSGTIPSIIKNLTPDVNFTP